MIRKDHKNIDKKVSQVNCSGMNNVECISPNFQGLILKMLVLKVLRILNQNRIVLAHLNINSLRNKFDLLADQIKGNVDVLAILETKLEDSLHAAIPSYASPFRLDRNKMVAGSWFL